MYEKNTTFEKHWPHSKFQLNLLSYLTWTIFSLNNSCYIVVTYYNFTQVADKHKRCPLTNLLLFFLPQQHNTYVFGSRAYFPPNGHFLTFSACFKIPIFFSNLNSNCSNFIRYEKPWSRNKLKNHSVTKNSSDLSLFE